MPPSTRGRCGVPDEVRDHREVAAPQRAFAGEIGTVERALDLVAVAAEQSPAVIERERRRRGGAEVERGHRAGERRHAGVRERRQLERGEVAVAHPSLARARRARESRCDRGGATSRSRRARRSRARRAGSLRHAHDGGEPLVVGRREALPAHLARRIDDHAMTERLEPRRGAVDRRRLGREARRREEADAVTCARSSGRAASKRRRRIRTGAYRIRRRERRRRPSRDD